jgi:phage terminase large subunit-like protein
VADGPAFEYPDGFERWPAQIQAEWIEAYHALYFPKLRWWEKPETDDEDTSGPRGKQTPPDHPRHRDLDLQGYHCGCPIKHPAEDRDRQLTCGCGGNPDWWLHLIMTGRGFGKSKMGSNWTLEMGLSKPGIYVGVCAPTYDMVRSICFEGDTGVLTEAARNDIPIKDYNKNRLEILLENGSKIRGFSAEKPDSIRGENLSYVWFDELAMIRYFAFYHEGLMPALRKGKHPRMMITTTPKRIRLLRDLLADGENEAETGVHVTRGHSRENPHFARRQREALERKYAGTQLLKQELEGELIGDADGSLFPLEMFNDYRVFPEKDSLPQWRRLVVAIDPATTSKESSDETGICVAAEGDDGDFYILEDCSGKFAPDQQMHVVADAFYRHSADCVVAEVNMTGDYMRALLNTVEQGSNIPLRTVHGMRGKVSRAQGPSSLFMQGRIHMVGDNFTELELQLSAMTEGEDRSRMKDDRADSAIWALIHLAGANQGDWGAVYGFTDCTGCGSRVNFDKDEACGNCGKPVTPPVSKHAGGRPAREPWSAAYLNTCPKCEKRYSPRYKSCPDCVASPEDYMRKALAMQQGGGGWHSYQGKDWLAGRRF